MPRSSRDESQYAIDAGRRLLKVLLALEGTNFEAVSIQRVQQRTGFSYDFCRRALITLKLEGFAAETRNGWTAGPKTLIFSDRFNDLCMEAMKRPEFPNLETQT